VGAALLGFLASPTGVTVTVFVGGYAALSSTSHAGFGFIGPLVPLAVCLGVAAIWTLDRPWRLALASCLLLSAGAVALGKTLVDGPAAAHRCVSLPTLGCAVASDGSTPGFLVTAGDPDAARSGELGAWARAGDDVVLRVIDATDGAPTGRVVLAFASRDPLVNTNTVSLAWRLREGDRLPVAQLRPDIGGDEVDAYAGFLADPRYGQATLLLAIDPGPGEFQPRVTQAHAEAAARCLGFELVDRWQLPDEREARLYQRTEPVSAGEPACGG
jgi:hypothetical protein